MSIFVCHTNGTLSCVGVSGGEVSRSISARAIVKSSELLVRGVTTSLISVGSARLFACRQGEAFGAVDFEFFGSSGFSGADMLLGLREAGDFLCIANKVMLKTSGCCLQFCEFDFAKVTSGFTAK